MIQRRARQVKLKSSGETFGFQYLDKKYPFLIHNCSKRVDLILLCRCKLKKGMNMHVDEKVRIFQLSSDETEATCFRFRIAMFAVHNAFLSINRRGKAYQSYLRSTG